METKIPQAQYRSHSFAGSQHRSPVEFAVVSQTKFVLE
jgi:hypothetical protein